MIKEDEVREMRDEMDFGAMSQRRKGGSFQLDNALFLFCSWLIISLHKKYCPCPKPDIRNFSFFGETINYL
jgi:hypothetical protein